MADIYVRVNDTEIKLFARDSLAVHRALDVLAARAVVVMKAAAPVSKVQRVYASPGATVAGGTRYGGDFPLRPSGYLRSSIHAEKITGSDIWIGSRVSYAKFVDRGTPPHVIRSTGPWPLRNRATGQVFGPVVHHPGTQPTRFVEKAAEALRGSKVLL